MSKIIFLKNLQTLLTPLKRLIDRKAENVNWNENDPSASGYIANRPFYKEIKSTDLIPSMNVDFSECWNTTKLPVFDLIRGETYTVIFDGVEYQCVAVDDGYGGEALGNFYLIGGGADTGEPFFIYEEEGGEWVGIAISIEEEVTCNIQISGKQATVHKIDSEYLPETIGIQGIGDRAEVFNSGNPEQASGTLSHAEGFLSEAAGLTSHAEGYRTIAGSSCQHAQGQYNIADRVGKYAHIVGNGSESNRSNAHTLDWNGNAWFAGEVYVGGTDQNSGERLAKISEIPDNLVNGTSDGSLRTINSIPESDTYRIGENAFAIGKDTKASGFYSQAQGLNTIALTKSLNVIGENNLIEDNVSSEIIKKQLTGHRRGWDTYYLLHGTPTIDEVSKCFVFESVEATKFYLLQVGDLYTTTNTTTPTVYDEVLLNKTEPQVEATSKWNRYSILSYTEKRGKYAQVVGNGESDSSRSNAHTLDWNGVGWFAGGLKVGGTGQDDEAAVEVALKSDITTYSDATASAAGLVSTGTQTFGGAKTFNDVITAKRLVISDTGANRHLRFSREGFNYIAAPETGTIAFSFGENANEDNTTLAIHTDTVKLYSGNTANFADGTLKIKTLNIPTASNGTTYGAGTSGQVLKSNGSTIYWGNDVDTTYSAATTTAAGLMTAAMVTKLNGIASGANAYTHPSHTSKSSGLYKITVDSQGHVSAATAIAKSDITALGIPAQDTTYSAATASAAGLMSTGAQTFAGAKTFNNTLSAKTITITDTASGKHIAFSREGWNYIMAPATGTIAFACADTVDSDNATVAITADGTTLKGTTNVASGTLKLKTLNIPTSSGGSTYGAGSSGQVLKSNGTTVYWSSDIGSDAVSKTSTTTQTMAASLALRDRSTTEDSWRYFGSTRYIASAEKGYTFQMGIGSAGAATLLLYESSDTNTSLNSMTLNPDSTVFKKPVTISSGGTGATTASEACNNLGAAIVGVGESIPSGADLNTYTTPGSYRSYQASISASLLNTPYTGTGFKLEVFNTSTANQIMQEIKANAATSRTYRRTASLSNGTWTFNSWVKVMHSTSDTLAIGDGGTGASTADGACQNLGAVRKSGDTMTGGLTAARLAVVAEYPTLGFKSGTKTNENAFIQVNVNGTIGLYSYNDDQDSKTTRYYEGYYLPTPDSGRTAKKTYPILTGKSPVTVAQGGTGATTAKAALTNLGIVYSSTQPTYVDGKIWLKPV